MLRFLDPNAEIFAVVNPCAPAIQCSWEVKAGDKAEGKGCTANAKANCANLSYWKGMLGAADSRTQLYGEGANAIPGNGCSGAKNFPPKASRFYYQFWGWQQCLKKIMEAEEAQGFQYDVLIKTRPDLCFSRGLKPLKSGAPHIRTIMQRMDSHTRGSPPSKASVAVARETRFDQAIACPDVFGVVARTSMDTYLSTIDQYFKCSEKWRWDRFAGTRFKSHFDTDGRIPGEPILGKQLYENNVVWKKLSPLDGLLLPGC